MVATDLPWFCQRCSSRRRECPNVNVDVPDAGGYSSTWVDGRTQPTYQNGAAGFSEQQKKEWIALLPLSGIYDYVAAIERKYASMLGLPGLHIWPRDMLVQTEAARERVRKEAAEREERKRQREEAAAAAAAGAEAGEGNNEVEYVKLSQGDQQARTAQSRRQSIAANNFAMPAQSFSPMPPTFENPQQHQRAYPSQQPYPQQMQQQRPMMPYPSQDRGHPLPSPMQGISPWSGAPLSLPPLAPMQQAPQQQQFKSSQPRMNPPPPGSMSGGSIPPHQMNDSSSWGMPMMQAQPPPQQHQRQQQGFPPQQQQQQQGRPASGPPPAGHTHSFSPFQPVPVLQPPPSPTSQHHHQHRSSWPSRASGSFSESTGSPALGGGENGRPPTQPQQHMIQAAQSPHLQQVQQMSITPQPPSPAHQSPQLGGPPYGDLSRSWPIQSGGPGSRPSSSLGTGSLGPGGYSYGQPPQPRDQQPPFAGFAPGSALQPSMHHQQQMMAPPSFSSSSSTGIHHAYLPQLSQHGQPQQLPPPGQMLSHQLGAPQGPMQPGHHTNGTASSLMRPPSAPHPNMFAAPAQQQQRRTPTHSPADQVRNCLLFS